MKSFSTISRRYDRGHVDWYRTAFWLFFVPGFSFAVWALVIMWIRSWFV